MPGQVSNVQKNLVPFKGITVNEKQQTAYYKAHNLDWRIVNFPNPPQNALSTGYASPITWTGLDLSAAGQVEMATLRFGVSNTTSASTASVLPVPYWFYKIEISSGGNLVHRMYADQIRDNLMRFISSEKSSYLQRLYNFSHDNYFRAGPPVPYSSEISYFYLPLVNSWIDNANALGAMYRNLTLTLYPISGGIITAGSGSITLNSIDLILSERDLAPQDRADALALIKSYPLKCRISQPIQVLWVNQYSFSGGAQTLVPLTGINGPITHVSFRIRQGGQLTGGTSTNYLSNTDLGEQATITIQDNAGTDLLTHSSPLKADNLRGLEMARQYQSFDINDWVYTIPFGSIKDSLAGILDGYMYFHSDRSYNLSIVPDSNQAVSEVHTVTLTQTNNAGVYCFQIAGCSSKTLAYNAATSSMASALAGMDCFARAGLTASNFTCSATAAASFTISINLSNTQLTGVGDKWGAIQLVGNLNLSGTDDTPSSAVTTYYRRGFPSSAQQLCIDILAYQSLDVVSKPDVANQYLPNVPDYQ